MSDDHLIWLEHIHLFLWDLEKCYLIANEESGSIIKTEHVK